MKKLLLLVAVLYSVTGWGQAGNLIHSYIPTWSTSARPTLTNGDIGINTDSSKLQFNIGGTTFTVGGSGGGGTTYTASGGVSLTGTNFTLTNDSAIATGNYYYGFSTSPSAGRYGFWPLPGGVSGLTAGYVPYATSATTIANSTITTNSSGKTIFAYGSGYSTVFGYGAGNIDDRFNGSLNIFNDSAGAMVVGSTTQYNSGVFSVTGVSTFNSTVYVGSGASQGEFLASGTTFDVNNNANGLFLLHCDGQLNVGMFPSGRTSIGGSATDNNSGYLQLPATTTTVASLTIAPSSAVVLTTPVNGAIENNGSHLYATLGGTRYQLDQQSGTNIYNTNGTLTGNRTVTLGGNTLAFSGLVGPPSTFAAIVHSTASDSGTYQVPLAYGTFTPTLTNTTNITSSTNESATYTRIGNIVHVNIACLVTPTTASTASVLTFTLPFTTSNSAQINIGSAALDINSAGVATYTSGIVTLASTTTGTLSFICTSLAGTSNVNIQFDYAL